MAKPSLLFQNITLCPHSESPLQEGQWLLCEKGRIHSFGAMNELPQRPDATVIEGRGRLLMPGLVNGHNHCAMTLFRGLADDLELMQWLNEHIFPAEAAHVSGEMVYWCTKLAAAEMILSGTSTVADGYYYEEQAARALLQSGMRAIPAHAVVDFPAPGVADPGQNIEAVASFIEKWQGRDSRIRPGVFAHSAYTCSPKTLTAAKELASQHQLPFFIHVAESRAEQALLMEPQGTSPIRHLAALDLLDSNTVLVHCVWLDDEDREIIKASGAGVVVCPQSNLKLSSGIAASDAMDRLGIPLGIGSDGPASNNGLDLFREMDCLAKGQKLSRSLATAMPAGRALAAATSGGAQLLGLDKLGKIVPGWKADLIMVDTNRPHLQPLYSSDTLVYSGSGADVDTMVIDGELVLRDRELLSFDLEQCLSEVRRLAARLGAVG